jgi:hypothetical protein
MVIITSGMTDTLVVLWAAWQFRAVLLVLLFVVLKLGYSLYKKNC